MAFEPLLPSSLDPSRIVLSPGAHASREEGMCAMEMVAWLAGVPHTDRPWCTSEVIAAYVRHVNDHAPDDIRHQLIPRLPRLIGTNDPGVDLQRGRFLAWKAIRVFAPMAMRRHGEHKAARALERAATFDRASRVAHSVFVKERSNQPRQVSAQDEEPTPFGLVAYRAMEAADAARRFRWTQCDGPRDLNDPSFWLSAREASVAAHKAAGTVFQASRDGCDGIWDEALKALDEVLEVRDEYALRAEQPDFDALLRMYREHQGKQQGAK